jgi:hypothetical protein
MLRHKYSYGEHPSQWGELFIPEPSNGNHRGVSAVAGGIAVVIHGGYWRSQYGAELGEPLARDLAAHGITAWNLEYRRAGNGGGWPHTFEDILAGIDHLVQNRRRTRPSSWAKWWRLATQPVATWPSGLPGRQRLSDIGTPDADRQLQRSPEDNAVHLTGVVSQSGLLNLAAAEKLNLSNGAVCNLMGGDSHRYPKRHKYADPMSLHAAWTSPYMPCTPRMTRTFLQVSPRHMWRRQLQRGARPSCCAFQETTST